MVLVEAALTRFSVGPSNKNFRRVTGFLKPKAGGSWTFMLSNEVCADATQSA